MRQSKLEGLWVICDTQEKCFIKFGAKGAWVSTAAAKNAWACHNYNYSRQVTFNEQSRYVVLNVFAPYSWADCIEELWEKPNGN